MSGSTEKPKLAPAAAERIAGAKAAEPLTLHRISSDVTLRTGPYV